MDAEGTSHHLPEKKFCKLGRGTKHAAIKNMKPNLLLFFSYYSTWVLYLLLCLYTTVLILLLYLGFVHIFTICYDLLCYYSALCFYLLLCYFVCYYCAHCYCSTWVLCTCNWIRMNTTGKNFISGIIVNIHINIYSHGRK